MRFSFRIKLLASHCAIALVAGAVAVVVIERGFSSELEAQLDDRLTGQGRAVVDWLGRARHYDPLAGRLAGVVGARVTFLDADGVSLGDSHPDIDSAPGTRAEAGAPEIAAARAGGVGAATRYSPAERQDVRYVALPAREGMIVRLGAPLDEIERARAAVRSRLALGAGASLAVAIGLAAVLAISLSRRLRDASTVAARIGRGDYDLGPPPDDRDEVGILSRTLAESAAALRENEDRRRAFLANVAHELRTPVTSIRGFAETLQAGDVDDATRVDFLHTIHRNAVRIGRLVDDLLELEALQARDPRQLASDVIDVRNVAEQVARTLAARTEERGADIALDVPEGTTARGDADAIERILLNLVDNALIHGGRGVRVRVRGQRAGDRTVIEVIDTGPGIASEHLGRVFDRMYRTPDAPRGTGSGLGLAIAKQLAEAMGGALSADSEPGRGSTFRLSLPG